MKYGDINYQINRDDKGDVTDYTMKYNGKRLGTTKKVGGQFSFTPYRDDGPMKPVTKPRMLDIKVELASQLRNASRSS